MFPPCSSVYANLNKLQQQNYSNAILLGHHKIISAIIIIMMFRQFSLMLRCDNSILSARFTVRNCHNLVRLMPNGESQEWKPTNNIIVVASAVVCLFVCYMHARVWGWRFSIAVSIHSMECLSVLFPSKQINFSYHESQIEFQLNFPLTLSSSFYITSSQPIAHSSRNLSLHLSYVL